MHDVMKGGTDRKHRESTAVVNVLIWIIRRWYENEKRRKEQEHSHVRIELQNLKNQLNPHFLFNALNNIYSFIGSDSDHARRSLDSLCELLRYALYRSTAVTGLRYILGKKCLLSATISTSQENGFRTIRISMV